MSVKLSDALLQQYVIAAVFSKNGPQIVPWIAPFTLTDSRHIGGEIVLHALDMESRKVTSTPLVDNSATDPWSPVRIISWRVLDKALEKMVWEGYWEWIKRTQIEGRIIWDKARGLLGEWPVMALI